MLKIVPIVIYEVIKKRAKMIYKYCTLTLY